MVKTENTIIIIVNACVRTFVLEITPNEST